MIHGYHQYKGIWECPSEDDALVCEREIGNTHDTHAVAIRKDIEGEARTVGHIPRKISSLCSIFIRRGGTICCKLTDIDAIPMIYHREGWKYPVF